MSAYTKELSFKWILSAHILKKISLKKKRKSFMFACLMPILKALQCFSLCRNAAVVLQEFLLGGHSTIAPSCCLRMFIFKVIKVVTLI